MPQQVTSFFRRLGDTIRGFSVAQRVIAVIGVAVIGLGAAGLAMWASQPSYTPLFSGLQAADASAIVDQLRTDGVPYQLTDGGGTILVPQEKVYDERLKAASAGLPTSTTNGYSLLDKMGVTSSEFQQSVTYKRAMEGELANTISAMKGVKTASVRLAIPADTVFTSQKQDPTASVFIEPQAGVTLSSDQVQAIVHLTSAAVTGMQPTDVSVVDANGNVLSTVGAGATGGADKQANDYESRVKTAVQDMLDKVVGAGNATVAVAADVSNESAQRTTEQYTTPTNAPATSETTQKETYTGSGGSAAGVLGPDNIAVPNGSSGNGTFNSESSTKDNAVDKVTEQRTIPAGAVTRQTVSVAVNSDAVSNVSANELRNMVNAAAGINTARGDSVSVQLVPFSKTGATEAAKAIQEAKDAAAADQLTGIIRSSIIGAAIVAAAIIAFALFRRSRKRAAEDAELEAERAESLAMEASPFPVALDPAPPTVPMQLDPLPDPTAPELEAERRRQEIEALAERDPQKTAEFLRSLMEDRAGV
ncbi:flagellar basal-body MS-ring/collar protein FliF [Leifsonia shinshuensis]|uniref:Flagellar M-ring protein n=1 Tax=Leifsonia shinshuensis TaxID=150026 RepID=A0A853CTE6_9MICO|nr:flagellar basal-body MS-ring/collar protein FliF [Leifsonia shinshuensis]NYJ22110.1 flagellar M-ring protein FliF [Leifsonia shinshuensis]